MKKMIIGGIAILVIAITVAFNVNISKQKSNMSQLVLGNIEALAQSETITVDCDQWYSETCVEIVINGTKTIVPGRKK